MSNICNLKSATGEIIKISFTPAQISNGSTGWYMNADAVEVMVTLPSRQSQGAEMVGYYSTGSSAAYTPGAATQFRLTNPDNGSTYTGQIA